MSRRENFYHGTKAEIPIGGLITPASKRGGVNASNYGELGKEEGQPAYRRAFASASERSARFFANMSKDWNDTGLVGHVYDVEPVGRPKPGLFYGGFKEYLAPAWRVISPPHHTPPPGPDRVRQGVLPVSFKGVAKAAVWKHADDLRSAELAGNVDAANAAQDRLARAYGIEEEPNVAPAYPHLSRQFSDARPGMNHLRALGRVTPDDPEPERRPEIKGQEVLF
jgi:hypothetical protein